jgi:hypothetical protein
MPDRIFTIFHLNLVAKPEPEFDTFRGTRDQWLRHVLAETFAFPHFGGATVHWVPRDEDTGECIFGLLQKTRKHGRHRPPTEGGDEVVEDEWQGAHLLLDPTHHEEGQRVAVENDVVGKPAALLKSLIASINARPDSPYHIEIEPLFDANEFWVFAEHHGYLMRFINFNFVVPNMWSPYNDLEKDLEDTGKETGAQRVRVGFDSEDGVLADSPRIRRGVEYAERGAGTLDAKALDGAKFKSTSSVRTTLLPAALGIAAVVVIASLRDRMLGREQSHPMGHLDDGDRRADRD